MTLEEQINDRITPAMFTYWDALPILAFAFLFVWFAGVILGLK